MQWCGGGDFLGQAMSMKARRNLRACQRLHKIGDRILVYLVILTVLYEYHMVRKTTGGNAQH